MAFQGLSAAVKLQKASKELKFSFFIVDAYLPLHSKYWVSRRFLKISLFSFLSYFLLKASNVLRIIVSSSVHMGTRFLSFLLRVHTEGFVARSRQVSIKFIYLLLDIPFC